MLAELTFALDIVCIGLAIVGFYFSYRLWSSLGRHGITGWLMLAMTYSVFLRFVSIFKDFNLNWKWLDYSRTIALPLYLFLAIGLCGLYSQVRNKLTGNGHNKLKWLHIFINRKKHE